MCLSCNTIVGFQLSFTSSDVSDPLCMLMRFEYYNQKFAMLDKVARINMSTCLTFATTGSYNYIAPVEL